MDILGRRVEMLANEHKTKGDHIVSFNALKLSSGIYFYRIETPAFNNVKKMVLIK